MFFASRTPKSRVVFLEEPLCESSSQPFLSQLRCFSTHSGIPVALDESLQVRHCQSWRLPEPFPGLAALVVKPTLAGGLHRSRSLAQMARRNDLQFVVSSSYESNIGIDTLSCLAWEQAPDCVPWLDTLSVFRHFLLESPLSSSISERSVICWSQLKAVQVFDE